MSQIVDDLRQVAIEIKTETQVGGNTAARVGGAFERVADALEGTQQIEDMDEAVAAVQQAAQENEQTIQDIVNSLAVVQETGQSTSAVMSQKAVTDSFLRTAEGISSFYLDNSAFWEQGAISSTNGEETSSTTRIRTKEIAQATDTFTITPISGYQMYVIYYADGAFTGSIDGWQTTEITIHAGEFYRLVLSKTNSSTISPSDATGKITIADNNVDKRLLIYKDDVATLSQYGGNLFNPATGSGSSVVTLTRSNNSVTLKTTRSITSNQQGHVATFNNLQAGKRYRLTLDYSFGSKVILAIRNSSNTALVALTSKRDGNGKVSREFVADASMSYLGIIIYSGVASNTQYVFSNIAIYEVDSDVDMEIIDMDNIAEMYGVLGADNKWTISSPNKFALIDVSKHKNGQAIISSTKNSVVAFLANDNHIHGLAAQYAGGTSRQYVNDLTTSGVHIPHDAQYMYVSCVNSSGESNKPEAVSLVGGYSQDKGITEFQQLIKKRAMQLNNLRWTALSNIAGNYCTAGDKVGMLYSSCVEVDRYVMFDISVKTFMTAANNPYSLLYTENLKTNVSQYGFTYYNHMATVHAWMGTVCSRFVFQCLGYEDFDTIHFAWLCKQGILKRSKSQASKDVEMGDVIWINGHTRIIYDVSDDGSNKKIIVSEAIEPLVASTLYTPSTLDTYMSSNHGIFYKYAAERNMVYEPSEFVNNYGEPLPDDYVYNDDICTYAGDYAAFRVGYPVWLNYNLKNVGTWTKIQLYKENWSAANVMTLSLVSEYTIDASIHKFQIPAADIAGYGKYRARMSDGNNYSDYTYFEIIDTTVSYSTPNENNPNVKKVTFSSANAGYVKVVFCNRGGTPMAVRPLSIEDKINCEITINPVETCLAQRGETLDTSNTYLKVYFIGEYGRVTNDYIKVDF